MSAVTLKAIRALSNEIGAPPYSKVTLDNCNCTRGHSNYEVFCALMSAEWRCNNRPDIANEYQMLFEREQQP